MSSTALITGASSGIGRELARCFARAGHHLVLVARNRAQLEQLAQDLRRESGLNVTVLVQDLAAPGAAQAIYAEMQQQSIQIDILVNNAGTQVYGEFAQADPAALLDLIQVNVAALTQLTRLFLPGMVARKQGKILNVGSTGSFTPGPLNAVYCATKAYVLSLSQALAAELVNTPITVTVLCPGSTDTAFATRHGMENVRLFQSMMSAETVAAAGYRGLKAGKLLVVPGWMNRVMVVSYRLLLPLVPIRWIARAGSYMMGRA